jgi:hypothetical protein
MAKVFTITEGLENMGALKTGGQGSVYKARRIGEIITAVKLAYQHRSTAKASRIKILPHFKTK